MDILVLIGIAAVIGGAVWATRRNEGKRTPPPSQPSDFTDSEGSVAPKPKPKAKAAPKKKPAGRSRTKAPTQKK